MRIIVGESGDISTKHTTEEFGVLQRNVILGSLAVSEAHRQPDFLGAEGEIGPMIVTPQAAQNVATVTSIRNARGLEMSRLVNETLDGAETDTESEGTVVLQWQDRDAVRAVRSRLFVGMLESGYRPGRSRTDAGEVAPDEALYDGLHVLERVLGLPPTEAAEQAAQFNDAALSIE